MMKHSFRIAGWRVNIVFDTSDSISNFDLLPSFAPFEAGEDGELLLSFVIDNELQPVDKGCRQLVRTFNDGNGNIRVDRISDGGYQFVIRDNASNDTALLVCDATFSHCRCALVGTYEMQRFGLTSALMLAYAYAGAAHGTLLMHASVVIHASLGYAFVAKSGTGKSTQTSNWLHTIPDTELLNDDTPVVRLLSDGTARVYGSPWSGKTPCYRQRSAPLAAVTLIVRDSTNHARRLPTLLAFGTLLTACSTMKWDNALYSHFCDTVSATAQTVPVYALHCTAEPLSADVCRNAIML